MDPFAVNYFDIYALTLRTFPQVNPEHTLQQLNMYEKIFFFNQKKNKNKIERKIISSKSAAIRNLGHFRNL